MSAPCPHCQRTIYSRRHKSCGFCGKALPAELLLTEAEIAALDKAEAKVKAELTRRKLERDHILSSADGSTGMIVTGGADGGGGVCGGDGGGGGCG